MNKIIILIFFLNIETLKKLKRINFLLNSERPYAVDKKYLTSQ